jgi:hypothetical protein
MSARWIARVLVSLLVVSAADRASATTFVVPDDAELVQKSDGIITGVVTSFRAVEVEHGYIETEYEIALDRVLKGPFAGAEFVRVSSPGGTIDNRFTHVESAAHFQIGDEVLLFLTRNRGEWTTTDMTLGKFTSAVTSRGYRVAVRDAEDIVGWDRDGKVHEERIRLEAEFLQFIQDEVAGRKGHQDSYEVGANEVLAVTPTNPSARSLAPIPNLFPAPASTYAIKFRDCSANPIPGRWETSAMTAGVPFFKNSAQNASGLGDGGVGIIQNALNAWTNDCESAVKITYGGTTPNLKNGDDNINVVIFNDPGSDVPGSWTGSGVIATTFSNGGTTHSFDSGTWVSYSDADVVFQNGYAGTEASIEEAMTHEIGHGIGFRHSDKHHQPSCSVLPSPPNPPCSISCAAETACDSNSEECAAVGAAIMASAVTSSMGFVLQSYDQHAADALYPGTCVVVTAPTNVVATATSATNVHVTWTASVGALSYNVYRSTNGSSFSNVGSSGTTSFDSAATANTAYLYKVTAVNVAESAFSNSDLATTVVFTDDPLTTATLIKAAHITQLRTAVNAVRTLASLGAGSYTDPTITPGTTTVLAAHVLDLRNALDAARSNLSLPALSYAETITAGVTPVKTSHVIELRNGVK